MCSCLLGCVRGGGGGVGQQGGTTRTFRIDPLYWHVIIVNQLHIEFVYVAETQRSLTFEFNKHVMLRIAKLIPVL